MAIETVIIVEACSPARRVRPELVRLPSTPTEVVVRFRVRDPAKPPRLVRVRLELTEDPTGTLTEARRLSMEKSTTLTFTVMECVRPPLRPVSVRA